AGLLAFSMMPITICNAASDKATPEPQKGAEGKALENDVKSQTDEAIKQKRKEIIDEAVAALTETKNALKALDEKKTKDALAALERASGKLNIVLAREPNLALAPVEVEVIAHDVNIALDEIKKLKKQAEEYLEDGQVQKARRLLRDLASEINISVTSLPLKTYPTAIAAATALIDQGKIEDAKLALEAALNTLVVTDHIISLPHLRAEAKLTRAEALAQKEGRSEEDNRNLTRLLHEVREQLKFGEALGYGTKKDHKMLYAEIDQIESKTKDGKSGKGFFADVKERLSELSQSIFG
ncbi:MAG TPA: YfdX family protein, partial [Nitrospira sp.]|nr:YfdX family protein [Nitrospira sp.]